MLMSELDSEARQFLVTLCRKLARRLLVEYPEVSHLVMLRHIRDAADEAVSTEIMLMTALTDRPSWRTIGRDLGTSAQAAHRRYAGRR
jgi:hypothetical protein